MPWGYMYVDFFVEVCVDESVDCVELQELKVEAYSDCYYCSKRLSCKGSCIVVLGCSSKLLVAPDN